MKFIPATESNLKQKRDDCHEKWILSILYIVYSINLLYLLSVLQCIINDIVCEKSVSRQ